VVETLFDLAFAGQALVRRWPHVYHWSFDIRPSHRTRDIDVHIKHVSPSILPEVPIVREPEDASRAVLRVEPHGLDEGCDLAAFADSSTISQEESTSGAVLKAVAIESLHRVCDCLKLCIADEACCGVILQSNQASVFKELANPN
jgi:hypothetical protein